MPTRRLSSAPTSSLIARSLLSRHELNRGTWPSLERTGQGDSGLISGRSTADSERGIKKIRGDLRAFTPKGNAALFAERAYHDALARSCGQHHDRRLMFNTEHCTCCPCARSSTKRLSIGLVALGRAPK